MAKSAKETKKKVTLIFEELKWDYGETYGIPVSETQEIKCDLQWARSCVRLWTQESYKNVRVLTTLSYWV